MNTAQFLSFHSRKDTDSGKRLEGVQYSWEIRAIDDDPADTNELAKGLETGESLSSDGKLLKVNGYRKTADGMRVRCLAKGTPDTKDPRFKGFTYASPMYTFTTDPLKDTSTEVPVPSETRYGKRVKNIRTTSL